MRLYNCVQCGHPVEHTGYSGKIGFTCRACALAPVETACEACTRYREQIAALDAELERARQALAEALVDTSPPTEEEIAYARQLEEAGR